jgi:hypothetical protein
VLNADRALWVICFVGCAAGGTPERGVDACTPGAAGRDGTGVVTSSVLLGAYGAGWFVCFAQSRMVSIALAMMAVCIGCPCKISIDGTQAVANSE